MSLPVRRRTGSSRGRPSRDDPGDHDREAGSATVWVAIVIALVVAVSSAALLLASMSAARQRADAAADLAALAGATALAQDADPCASASRVALADGAVLDACQVSGAGGSGGSGDVQVTAEVPLPAPLSTLGLRSVRARSRAGPATVPAR